MQWIDANAEDAARRDARAGYEGPRPVLGVCFRSECGKYRVASGELFGPAELRVWTVWDMTGIAPTPMIRGCKSLAVAQRAGEAVAASRVLRVGLRLAAIGRAVAASVRRLTA